MSTKKEKETLAPNFTDMILSQGGDSSEESSDKKYMEMMISEIFSKRDMELRSRVSQGQILAMSKTLMYASHFESPLLKAICYKILELQVSLDGKGRQEFTQIATNVRDTELAAPNLAERLGFK